MSRYWNCLAGSVEIVLSASRAPGEDPLHQYFDCGNRRFHDGRAVRAGVEDDYLSKAAKLVVLIIHLQRVESFRLEVQQR